MRVITGKHRGRKLYAVTGNSTRPTTDRVKESLFNIIQMRIYNAAVLDLFAGSGALGIECLSRGAREVLFCDADRNAVEVILKNLRNIEGNYKVVNSDFSRVLKTYSKYDIIFIDAPYKSGLGERALQEIFDGRVLADNGIISYERGQSIAYKLPDGLKVTDSRKYGDTCLDFITYE